MSLNKNKVGLAAKIRRDMPGAMTVTETADILGVSPDTLVRWRKTGVFVPKNSYQAGQLVVPVYTGADIAAIRRLQDEGRTDRRRAAGESVTSAPTGDGFVHRLPPTYRTPAHMERLVKIENLLAEGKAAAAQAYLDRLSNITPSDRRFVQREIDAAR